MEKEHVRSPDLQAAPQAEACVPARFALVDMLAAVLALAVFLALLKAIGIGAVMLAFLGTIGLLILRRRAGPRSRPKYDLAIALLGGAILPVCCLMYDPLVFRTVHTQAVGYPIIGVEFLLLLVWLFAQPVLGRTASGLVGGGLLMGAVFALVVGVFLMPVSVAGLFVRGVGLLGFTPLVTAMVYFQQSRMALARTRGGWLDRTAMILGMLLCLAAPAVTYWYVTTHHPMARPVPTLDRWFRGRGL